VNDMLVAARAAGAPIEQAVAVFMLHPETFGASIAAGYQNPLAGYVAGRGGVLGDATGAAVSSVFVVFEPTGLAALWDEGVAVHGAAGATGSRPPTSRANTSPAPTAWTASPRWVRRSSRQLLAQGHRCLPAGAACHWPTMRRPGHCR
jgi:hypothetical protein